MMSGRLEAASMEIPKTLVRDVKKQMIETINRIEIVV